jgi:hypothetical protein
VYFVQSEDRCLTSSRYRDEVVGVFVCVSLYERVRFGNGTVANVALQKVPPAR